MYTAKCPSCKKEVELVESEDSRVFKLECKCGYSTDLITPIKIRLDSPAKDKFYVLLRNQGFIWTGSEATHLFPQDWESTKSLKEIDFRTIVNEAFREATRLEIY